MGEPPVSAGSSWRGSRNLFCILVMHWLPLAVVVLLLLRLAAQLALEALNRSETRLHGGVAP
ncbi:MAG TPA: hypothetical protein VK477_05135, partial [Acidobacteriota bacterium]|nr:hypothetical protein [Acidobacteriota bacterium]